MDRERLDKQVKGGRMSMIYDLTFGRRLRFLFVVFGSMFAIAIDSMIPQLVRFTIDNVLDNKEIPKFLQGIVSAIGGIDYLRNNIWILLVVFLTLILGAVTMMMFRRYLAFEFGEYLALNLRNKLFSHIQKLPFEWHVKNQTGDIIQRSTSDVDTIRNFCAVDIVDFLRCFFIIIISLSLMLSMDVLMTLIAVALLPFLIGFSIFYYKSIAQKFKDADEAEGVLQASVQENFTGVRVVRAFGREQFEISRFDEKNNNYVSKSLKVINGLANYWSIGDIIGGLQLVLVMCFGVYRAVHGDMTLGTFQTFYAYTSMLIWPVRNLGRTLSNFSKTTVSAKRIHEILSVEPETVADIKPAGKNYNFNNVEFKNVSFGYNGHNSGDNKSELKLKPILKNISFKLEKGKVLGILGSTGSGKSTISYLLTRLYDIDGENEGEILIDGVNIKEIPLYDIRRNISLVLQEPFLFSKTIKENIISPNPQAEESQMHHVASVANIHESIIEFPDKYDTIVGERGVTLSGGQKQRVAIARMLMQNAPVMIFDDSLSAVDTETDAKIRASLKQNTADSAVILISHRISTLMHSDHIMILQDGVVEDFGAHNELITREGTYKRIYDLQSAVVEEYKI